MSYRRGKNDTPGRNIRVADQTWAGAMARAAAEDTSLAAVLRDFLERYASGVGSRCRSWDQQEPRPTQGRKS